MKKDIQIDIWVDRSCNIDRCGNFLLNLINDILDLSKVEAGKIRVESKYGDGSTFTFTMPLPCANGRK